METDMKLFSSAPPHNEPWIFSCPHADTPFYSISGISENMVLTKKWQDFKLSIRSPLFLDPSDRFEADQGRSSLSTSLHWCLRRQTHSSLLQLLFPVSLSLSSCSLPAALPSFLPERSLPGSCCLGRSRLASPGCSRQPPALPPGRSRARGGWSWPRAPRHLPALCNSAKP